MEVENIEDELHNELLEVNIKLDKIASKIHDLSKQKQIYEKEKINLEYRIEKIKLRKLNEQTIKVDSSKVGSTKEYPWSKKLKCTLQNVFKIKNFRPIQEEAINATMENKNVLLIMSTGGGKSLTFQLPAVVQKGITLVISPLISLMEDQVYHLKSLGVKACFLHHKSEKEEINSAHNLMTDPNIDYQIIYITPERLSKSKRFLSKLQKCYVLGNLRRIVVDEVHCISSWGNDFRPDYKSLNIIKQFPKTPVLGLTATTTAKVTSDIIDILGIEGASIFRADLNRRNLFYEVRPKPCSNEQFMNELATICKETFNGESGLIYCFSRKDTEYVTRELQKRNVSVGFYHAYVDSGHRQRLHKKWNNNEIQVVVATVAFGMGIDKPDVRFVIHHSISKSIENYYQESGRAGRDGRPSLCLLYYGFSDIFRMSTMVVTEQKGLENLSFMIRYCHDLGRCRRLIICEHFNEKNMSCDMMCDICFMGSCPKTQNVTQISNSILKILRKSQQAGDTNRLTGAQLIKVLKKNKEASTMKLSEDQIQRVIVCLMLNRFICEDFHFTPYSIISYLKPSNTEENIDELSMDFETNFSTIQSYVNAVKRYSKDLKPSSKRKISCFVNNENNKVIKISSSDSED